MRVQHQAPTGAGNNQTIEGWPMVCLISGGFWFFALCHEKLCDLCPLCRG